MRLSLEAIRALHFVCGPRSLNPDASCFHACPCAGACNVWRQPPMRGHAGNLRMLCRAIGCAMGGRHAAAVVQLAAPWVAVMKQLLCSAG